MNLVIFFNTDVDQLEDTLPHLPSELSLLFAFCENRGAADIPSCVAMMTMIEVFTYLINLKINNSSGLDGIMNQFLSCAVLLYVNY